MSKTQYFVPRYCLELPNLKNLPAELLQISMDQLFPLLNHWQTAPSKDDLRRCSSEICRDVIKGDTAFEPFTRRPFITVNCCSKSGEGETGALFEQAMHRVGLFIAMHGFNLLIGNTAHGLMEATARGFHDQVTKKRFPDQYLVQVVPAKFIRKDASLNGLSASNEGLSEKYTDAIIIYHDMLMRRYVIDAGGVTTIIGPGSLGTDEEKGEVFCLIKTGQTDKHCYLLDMFVPSEGNTCWAEERIKLDKIIARKQEDPRILDFIHFMPTVDEIFRHLLKTLNKAGQNPHVVYRKRCTRLGIAPPPPTMGSVYQQHHVL